MVYIDTNEYQQHMFASTVIKKIVTPFKGTGSLISFPNSHTKQYSPNKRRYYIPFNTTLFL